MSADGTSARIVTSGGLAVCEGLAGVIGFPRLSKAWQLPVQGTFVDIAAASEHNCRHSVF